MAAGDSQCILARALLKKRSNRDYRNLSELLDLHQEALIAIVCIPAKYRPLDKHA